MKNLKLLYNAHKKTNATNPKFLVLDANGSDDVFFCTEDKLLRYNRVSENLEEICDVFEAVSCEHLALNNEICIATEIGEVIIVNLLTKQVQEVTFCEGGIEKMSWSPDQEVVAFVTKSQNVVVMTCTYDPISEYALTDDAFGEGEFITVGWGKKETQFHGSEGKQAAKQKSDFVVPENLSELPKDIEVTWRGDGELFAVSFLGPLGRMFKVFDKEGKLKFSSEKVNDLGTFIAWRPSGSWIAIPQKFPNKCTIALFEKNGLRHREIVLPFKFDDEPVTAVQWSSDSDILAIGTERNGQSQIYLYTIGNYHWYLKQFLRFDQRIVEFSWDSAVNNEKTLHVLLENGDYFVYRFTYTITHSFGDSMHNQALVGVVDGQSLLITDFRNGVIPPPMFRHKVDTSAYINHAGFLSTFNTDEDYNRFYIVDADQNVSFYRLVFEQTPVALKLRDAILERKLALPGGSNLNHLIWLSSVYLIVCSSEGGASKLAAFRVTEDALEEVSTTVLDSYVCSLVAGHAEKIFVSTVEGSVLSVEVNKGILSNVDESCSLPEVCETLKTFQFDGKVRTVALKANQSLFLESERIATDVTSFFLTRNYLAFTHLASMKFLRLKDGKIVDERKIERGGKLVTIVPADSRTVMQMPRGNLEAICPRVLSLEIVGEYLDNLLYGKAMDILRKQRINLNILCDHNMTQFLDNLDRFLDEIRNPQWLNLFLSDLLNEDLTRTMYAGNYTENGRAYPEGFKIEEKIVYICAKMCQQMELKDYNHFILPIITTYVKIGQIEKALEVIWAEKKQETNRAEEGLKYLLYLVDVNDLFNVALGMYDFGLVLFVATKSQKDPKEYIPFLNELKKHEENYRKFKIDEHLKRFEKALEHIAHCGAEVFDEALEFVQKHKLFRKALIAYQGHADCYRRIALAFADQLRADSSLENASIMYERGGDLSQAILSAKNGLDWRRCLALTALQSGGDRKELVKIAQLLVPALQENGKHEEAFYLLKTFVGDFEQALDSLMRGKLYLKAIYEARMESPGLLESKVTPDLLAYKDLLAASIQADRDLFIKHKTRLQTVRELKSRQNDDDAYDDNIDECDLLSDTTSMHSSRYSGSSSRTGKTFRSSKNRRKHERKLLSLKPGNPFEDIALIDALYNHITKVANQQEHIRDTCKSLLEIVSDAHAKEIQDAFKSLLKLMADSMDEIWIAEMQSAREHLTGPNIDYAQLQNEQRYGMISPVKRFKPTLTIIDWEHPILR